MTDENRKSRRRWLLGISAVALLVAAGVVGYLVWTNRPTGTASVAALRANNRGVGQMERFDYPGAEKEFEEATRLDPIWLPARINLGIALFNQPSMQEKFARARVLFRQVLAREPNNPHAHYCLGMMDLYQNQLDDAFAHFQAVSRIDPSDAHTWFHMGISHPKGKDTAEAREYFEKALKLNPYLNAARYNLAMHPDIRTDEKRMKALLADHSALMKAEWETLAKVAYSEMGPYANVIGRAPAEKAPVVGPLPMFSAWDAVKVNLGEGTEWIREADHHPLLAAVRKRFGSAVVALDFNRDGKPDLFLPGAVRRGGEPANLLLRNDGDGVFTDVTTGSGLHPLRASLGCSVADYDNDGLPDLLLTGIGPPRLYRNLGNGKFADVSKEAGLSDLDGVFLGSGWVDLDQDGDLDLVLCRFAGSPEEATARLEGKESKEGGFVVLLNVGESPAVPAGQPAPLTTKFEPLKAEGLKLSGAATTVAVGDLDGDHDMDLLLLADGKPVSAVWNDRLLRFRDGGTLGDAGTFNGALLLDVDHDGRSDLLTLPAGKAPLLWMSRPKPPVEKLGDGFAAGTVSSPPLRHAQAIDLDRDGWTDVVGLSAEGRPVLLQNDGTGKLVHRAGAFGPDDQLPKVLTGVAVVDLDGDGPPELVMLTDGAGLVVRRNEGNGNNTLRLVVTGKRDGKNSLHTNEDGIGAWVVAQAGALWTGQERATLSAGLGQSSLPMELGIGKNTEADVVRVRWPDGLPQAELNVAAGATVRITETSRKSTSCPVLIVWDGTRWRFVTDFLGGGALGEMGTDGSTRPPRPEESLGLPPGTLAPKDGWYLVRVTEPMDEVAYLDHLELVVIDHPAQWVVHPDERFVMAGPPPTQELLFLSGMRPAVRAVDHRGNDLTATLRARDGRMADTFHVRSWLGYAEEHTLELDFGAVPKGGGKWVLCCDGWTDYPYPESIWAAEQAKVPLVPPTLELPGPGGKWKAWGELGFPAGLPRTMTRDVTGLVAEGGGRFRIRSNMQVYWDRLLLAQRVEASDVKAEATITTLPVGRATLRYRGLAQEVTPGGSGPVAYDGERNEVAAISKWKGRLTRLGDVTELLTARDDRFVICGPGDEAEVGFDARKLPPVAAGKVRSFVLRTAGYSKDSSPFTLGRSEVSPLPFRAMSKYPPPRGEVAPGQAEYDRKWNTRRPRGGG